MQSMYILPPPNPVKLIHCALECSVKCLASAQAGLIYLMCWGQQIFTPAPCRRCGCLRQLRLRRCLLALRSWHLRTLDTELQIVFLSLSQTLLIFLTILLQFINDNEDVNFLQIKITLNLLKLWNSWVSQLSEKKILSSTPFTLGGQISN